MTIKLSRKGGAGWEGRLSPPEPLLKEINSITRFGIDLPTPDNDGTFIRLPSSGTAGLIKNDVTGTPVWTVVPADINAACDEWSNMFWLDTVDDAIWVWAADTNTSPNTMYLATVDLTTGAVTNIGTSQPTGDHYIYSSIGEYYYTRASMGSGDLTVRVGESKVVINTGTGALTADTVTVTQNGNTLVQSPNYETEDGAIYTRIFPLASVLVTGGISGNIQRGGKYTEVQLPGGSPAGAASPSPILWGGYVAIITEGTNLIQNARFFARSDFDDWLERICDFYGLPT